MVTIYHLDISLIQMLISTNMHNITEKITLCNNNVQIGNWLTPQFQTSKFASSVFWWVIS